MVRWIRWHCPPDTWFEIWAPAVWDWARFLSVTEDPHNIEPLRVNGEETLFFIWNLKARLSKQPAFSTAQEPPLRWHEPADAPASCMVRSKIKNQRAKLTYQALAEHGGIESAVELCVREEDPLPNGSPQETLMHEDASERSNKENVSVNTPPHKLMKKMDTTPLRYCYFSEAKKWIFLNVMFFSILRYISETGSS